MTCLQKKIILIVCTIYLYSCLSDQNIKKENWQYLLEKSNHKNWIMKIAGEPLDSNYLNTFALTEDELVVSFDKYKNWNSKFGHIFYNQDLSHYILECEYYMYGEAVHDAPEWAKCNSGIMLHAQSPQSMTFYQQFPISIEMQFLSIKNGVKSTTGNLCTPGTVIDFEGKYNEDHCINSNSPEYPLNKWIKAKAIVYGDSLIIHEIENREVMRYTKIRYKNEGIMAEQSDTKIEKGMVDPLSWEALHLTPLTHGYIAFQAESQNIKFRNIRLLNLCGCMNKKAKNYKSYFVKHDEKSCVF